jgi:hypothetical protein
MEIINGGSSIVRIQNKDEISWKITTNKFIREISPPDK